MKFLVIEGIDGSGKSTQIKLISKYLDEKNIPFQYIHFPRTTSRIYGDLIARFLRGDFGDLNSVDPYIVALLYAGDRMDASAMIRNWLEKGYLVLLDRYVYSNIAFQCAKLTDKKLRETLRKWILELEFDYHHIPRPDLNLLLDVPFTFTRKELSGKRTGAERSYLQGLPDIHEGDLEFQKRVREMYIWQSQTCDDFKIIDCSDKNGMMYKPETIFQKILKAADLTN
jgi:dTMP kinase